MNFKNAAYKHLKESAELKKRQKKEWDELLEKQEHDLRFADDAVGMASRFAREREEHNEKFDQEKADLIRQQQKELEQIKKEQDLEEPEHERD